MATVAASPNVEIRSVPVHFCLYLYDTVATVAENEVQWKSDFQSSSRVFKRCYEPFLIYLYVCYFMQKIC